MAVLFSEDLPPVPADLLCTRCGTAIATVRRGFLRMCRACWEAWIEARREAAAREPEF